MQLRLPTTEAAIPPSQEAALSTCSSKSYSYKVQRKCGAKAETEGLTSPWAAVIRQVVIAVRRARRKQSKAKRMDCPLELVLHSSYGIVTYLTSDCCEWAASDPIVIASRQSCKFKCRHSPACYF